MSKPVCRKNKEWSKEEKYYYVQMVVNGKISISQIHKDYGLSKGMLFKWVEHYNEEGIDGLQNKRKPGNPLVKYSKRKELTEIEQLEYENMLLRIENERLKKGYTEEDVILALEKSSEKNTK